MRHDVRIMVIDDNHDLARTLGALLRAKGYASHICTYSRDCLAAIEELRPQVVFLDLDMPGMSGYDVAEELNLHADLRPKVLVAITGHDPVTIGARVVSAGFDLQLRKPIDWNTMECVLERVREYELA